jgi:rod shape-determining protein MreC
VKRENDELKKELDRLRVTHQAERAQAQRSAHLQQLLDLRNSVALQTVAADVIGGDASPGLHTITINKGKDDGVRGDMAVISHQGVVGRVLDPVAPHASRVQLLVSRNAGAGVIVERSRAGGVIVGGGENPPLELEYIASLADVKVGDVVVTAGTDGIYPKGFPVGRVVSIERGAGMYRYIGVQPVVDFTSIEEVLVILSPPGPEGPTSDARASRDGAGK